MLLKKKKSQLFDQTMGEKIKTWNLRFAPKENPKMEKALFHWPVVLQYDVKPKYRVDFQKVLEHEVFTPKRSLNKPKPRAFVSAR